MFSRLNRSEITHINTYTHIYTLYYQYYYIRIVRFEPSVFVSELKPEGYVPVSKHSVSPWELVEGAKGGCNVVPWQELGGVRYDRQPDKMEVCTFHSRILCAQ